MFRVQFSGRVLPTSHSVSIGQYEVQIADNNFASDIKVKIENSEVTIHVDVENYEVARLGEICRRAIRIGKAAIDVFAFATGKGLILALEKITLPDGRTGPPVFDFAPAPQLCTSYGINDFHALLPITVEQDFVMAIGDLTDTITQPDRIQMNCARAVETIRAMIDPNERDRGTAWGTMQNRLNLSREYREFVSAHDTATAHRHGHYVEVGDDIGAEARTRAWTIMNRFIEYRKRGNQPLPLAEFPLL